MPTIFDRLSAHLYTSKKPQTHHNWFLINCARLVMLRGLWFKIQSSKSRKIFPEKLPIIVSTSWPGFMIKWIIIQEKQEILYLVR